MRRLPPPWRRHSTVDLQLRRQLGIARSELERARLFDRDLVVPLWSELVRVLAALLDEPDE